MKNNRIILYLPTGEKPVTQLKNAGYSVDSVNEEGTVIDRLSTGSYDVFITAAELPDGFSGLRLLMTASLLKYKGSPYIIAVTGLAGMPYRQRLIASGADEVINGNGMAPYILAEKLLLLISNRPQLLSLTLAEEKMNKTSQDVFMFLRKNGYSGISGTLYLADCITEVLYRPSSMHSLTKVVYPAVADKRGVTAAAVERCVRFSVHKVTEASNSVVIESIASVLMRQGLNLK